MSIQNDLEVIARQEARLQFDKFDASSAWDIGNMLKRMADERSNVIAIDIYLSCFSVFSFAMNGTTPDNVEWLRRKRNVVQRFHRSSYALGLGLLQRDTTLAERYGLSVADYAAHGGCFPIRIKSVGVVGSVGVSGLAQRDDHGMVVEALASYLGESIEELGLALE